MPTQLTLDFPPVAQPIHPEVHKENWLDVTEIARGVGFTGLMEVNVALNDALQSRIDEPDGGYDQRLYDRLWLAYLHWTFSEGEAATINFFFERADRTAEIRLRIRLELHEEIVRLDLLNEAACAVSY